MSDVKTQNVFVYGTLKRGQRNHNYLEDGGAEFVDEAVTQRATYLMKAFESVSTPGKFTPGVFMDGNFKIKGELYRVTQNTLDKIDKLEALGIKYRRFFVTLEDGHQGWMYVEIPGKRQAVETTSHISLTNNVFNWN